MPDWRLERLSRAHRREDFRSGQPPLDRFLQTLATQYEKRKLARTMVAVAANDSRVFGYYTLAAGGISLNDLPPAVARKLPDHPIPVILLGRLAVDQSAQRQGLGAQLLRAALQRCLESSEQVGVFAVTVAALNEDAKRFYLNYGFETLQDNDLNLFLPIKDIEKGLQ